MTLIASAVTQFGDLSGSFSHGLAGQVALIGSPEPPSTALAPRYASTSMNFAVLILGAAISAMGSTILCLNARRICGALGLLDVPDERKQHREITPLMGGLVLQLAFVPTATAYAFLNTPPPHFQPVLILLGCVVAMSLVGIADDRHSLRPKDRLLLSFLVFGSAAILHASFNVRLLDFEVPAFHIGLGTGWLAVAFTSLCCVGLVNAVNMADGKNGLVLGLSLGWLILLGLRAPPTLLPFIVILGAAVATLLAFNLQGRLFLGDGGAYGLATAVGLLSINVYNSPGDHAGRAISADSLVLIFLVPVLDSFRLTFTRLRRRQSPMSGDRDHLHHHLMNRFGWPGGLIVYWTVALGIGAAGIWCQH